MTITNFPPWVAGSHVPSYVITPELVYESMAQQAGREPTKDEFEAFWAHVREHASDYSTEDVVRLGIRIGQKWVGTLRRMEK